MNPKQQNVTENDRGMVSKPKLHQMVQLLQALSDVFIMRGKIYKSLTFLILQSQFYGSSQHAQYDNAAVGCTHIFF